MVEGLEKGAAQLPWCGMLVLLVEVPREVEAYLSCFQHMAGEEVEAYLSGLQHMPEREVEEE